MEQKPEELALRGVAFFVAAVGRKLNRADIEECLDITQSEMQMCQPDSYSMLVAGKLLSESLSAFIALEVSEATARDKADLEAARKKLDEMELHYRKEAYGLRRVESLKSFLEDTLKRLEEYDAPRDE